LLAIKSIKKREQLYQKDVPQYQNTNPYQKLTEMIGTGSSLLKPGHPKTHPLQGNEEPFEQQPVVTLMEDGSQRTEVAIPKKHHPNMTAFSPKKNFSQPLPAIFVSITPPRSKKLSLHRCVDRVSLRFRP